MTVKFENLTIIFGIKILLLLLLLLLLLYCYYITYFITIGHVDYIEVLNSVLNRALRKIIPLLIESTGQVCLHCVGEKEVY